MQAENITIPRSKAKPSFDNLGPTFDNIKYLLVFFNYIELSKVHFENNELKIIFADDILYITSNDYEIAGNVRREGQKFIADVSMLYIKKGQINIKGELAYYADSGRLETKGQFDAYNIKGRFQANKENDNIDFTLNSEAFTDLKTLIEKFPLKEAIKSWIVEKVQAKKYRLYALSGRGTLVDHSFKLDMDTLEGSAFFEDVKIHYKEGLAPVTAESFILTYRKGSLYFDLKKPIYKGRDLTGSKVSITNLPGSSPTMLNLDLYIKQTPIDSVVQEILKAYKLNIPVEQKNGTSNVNVELGIPLKKKSAQKISVYVDVDVGEGDIYIGKVKIPVLDGNVKYEKGSIKLKDIDLKESWYAGRVNGKIDLTKKKADMNFDADLISIGGEKEKFFVLKNKQLPLTLGYSKNIAVNIPTLKLKIVNDSNETLIQIGKIEKIKPYLKDFGLEVDGGKLDIRTKDFEAYTFKGELLRKSCFFYDKKNICYTRVPCSGKITKKGIDFYAFNKRLYYNANRSRIKLKDLNIDLRQFLSSWKKGELKQVSRKKSGLKQAKGKKIVILGQNSQIRYDKYILVTDTYDIEIKENGNIDAMGSLDGDIVKFNKTGKKFSVQALRVKDKMLHPLIHFKGLNNGRYTIKLSGDPDKVMKGQIIVEGGAISNFKAYNNTLALINALPALAVLKSPGFSGKGFKIKEGVIEYRIIGEKIIFDSVYIKGGTATVAGKGEVNMKKKTIHMDLAIRTVREFGKIVGNIPLLGYIFMGKDKSMTVGLKVTGTLDNPKVQTTAAQDVLTLPLQFLKRTIESPAHIINK
ncbi:MAG: hypothetical protein P794_09110 [Epsilonproteobacteria bacterium (ex Lamellibrachia satsuma)]|nr:MAG: hypothetical protein P794_09110 [Epsilonproteobacteria bacterium (ex Lamellibrachia satsuma)]